MSSKNEYIDQETVDQQQTNNPTKRKKRTKRAEKRSGGRLVVQIMNGEFLSRDWFVRNLPFTFYIGFLLVLLIGWGYYGESTSRKEVQLQQELSELNSEFYTLSSEYRSKRGRPQISEKLADSGVAGTRTSPKKIRVRRHVFK